MPDPQPIRPRWWQWPTVLSLDAPLVAVVWQWLFGAAALVAIRWPHSFVLGASVWLAYSADRWFEAQRLAPEVIHTPRHRFYRRHRLAVAVVWIAVLACDLAVAFAELSRRELGTGVILLVPTLAYLLSHQLVHRHHPFRPPKEALVAVLIASGASLFLWAVPGIPIRTTLPMVLLFAALCFANVALIATWEQEVDERHEQESLVRRFAVAATLSRASPLALVAAAAILGGLPRAGVPRVVAHCVAASAMLLVLIDRMEHRIGWQRARVLADFVLLTPLVPLWRGLS